MRTIEPAAPKPMIIIAQVAGSGTALPIGPAIVSRVKILGGMNIVERRRPQDGQISMDVEGRAVDIRVSSTAVVGGEKVVMRLLDKSRPLFQLEQLGMPPDTAGPYSSMIHAPYGMVICAGPTGGGKTTTLYASLGELNSTGSSIEIGRASCRERVL